MTPYVIVYNGYAISGYQESLVIVEQGYYATYDAAEKQIARWVIENKCCDGQYRVVGLRRVE